MSAATLESRREQALALKEGGNKLAQDGQKSEALKKYEKGIRLLGLPDYCLDEDGKAAVELLDRDGRELLSVLASNAAQMYMSLEVPQLSFAIERCSLAIEVNPANAKALFRRAAASHDHAESLAKGSDALLAQAQLDIRQFLQMDPQSLAGKQLQEKLVRQRHVLQPPLLREKPAALDSAKEPDWFDEVRKRAVFVCLCGTTATGRDQIDLPESLLSMAKQAKDKKTISVGVAYVGYKPPHVLEMFNEEWQKKYYRMLQLGERAVKVPDPMQVVVHGEVYNLWSLLDGRVRVLRVNETKQNGERVGVAWMRYCAQLLWHGEPFVYQSCRSYLRFCPRWDALLKKDLEFAQRRGQNPVILSWMAVRHEDEPWQWVDSEGIDLDGNNRVPTGIIVGIDFDKHFGWVRWHRRYLARALAIPQQVAFFSPHNSFSSSAVLSEVPADPFLNSLNFHGQITCENVRLFSHGWDIYMPAVNVTWETLHDASDATARLQGAIAEPFCRHKGPNPDLFDEQKVRADACLDPWHNKLSPLDQEILDMPVPTGDFWTSLRHTDPVPWPSGHAVGHRFRKGAKRTVPAWERSTGVELEAKYVTERAAEAGLDAGRGLFQEATAWAY